MQPIAAEAKILQKKSTFNYSSSRWPMPSMNPSKSVGEYFSKLANFKKEITLLRKTILECGLEENIKWGGPVYSLNDKNVVGLGAFKSYFGVWFFQGALLSDKKKILVNAQEGRTKALRQLRYHRPEDIDLKTLKAYVNEAAKLAQEGKEIRPDRNRPLEIPSELTTALGKNKKTKAAFDSLTLGKQRDYAEYIASAKQPATKQKRLEKILPMIASGIGLNDKYSKR
jgi:uncharacterized protein YdeI (YjbR/CyaY-like superfamily)